MRSEPLFASFLQAGFECATQRTADGRRLDLTESTGHAALARSDYAHVRALGMRTVRDGFRWHVVETGAGRRNWRSASDLIIAAREAGVQPIWDLMHFGWPDHIDIWSPGFVRAFAGFARECAQLVRAESDAAPFYCPVNEISFMAWAGGEVGYFNPAARGRGFELKCQLVRAALAAMAEIADVDPRARFVHCEPAIRVHPASCDEADQREAAGLQEAQHQAFDMLSGRLWPQLGGDPRWLDIVGLNYYPTNQWVPGQGALDASDPRRVPFRRMLAEAWLRYGRPLLVAETGAEGGLRRDWLEGVLAEVEAAAAQGAPVEGVCLYPVIDHLGWDDDRECPSGLLARRPGPRGRRTEHGPLAEVIRRWRGRRPGGGASASPSGADRDRPRPPGTL